MKVVIDIDDNLYYDIVSNKYGIYTGRIYSIISNGAPLPKEEWIPVRERLPEEGRLYLVSMNRLGYPQRAIDGFVCGKWERFGNDVLAWRLLPEAYKEGEE